MLARLTSEEKICSTRPSGARPSGWKRARLATTAAAQAAPMAPSPRAPRGEQRGQRRGHLAPRGAPRRQRRHAERERDDRGLEDDEPGDARARPHAPERERPQPLLERPALPLAGE